MGGDPYVSELADERREMSPPCADSLPVPDPYGDQALLTPAMTRGYDSVPGPERERLGRYLDAVVSARRAPVHTDVAFNAVYFGFDIGGDGYGASPLRLDDFPVITLGGPAPVLPVGAMVCVVTGSDPLYAEIVHREGAHPELGSLGDVPPWVSGAPVGAEGPGRPGQDPRPRRRELLVPDLHAFGPALSPSPAQLHRLRTRRRWINGDGHVVVDVCHPSPEAARRDEPTAYAEHLLTTAREQLLSPFVPVSLAELVGGTDENTLRAGLFGLLDTVRGVLNSLPGARTWGHYAMSRTVLADSARDTGPLGGGDLASFVAALKRAATPNRRRHGLGSPVAVYTATGPGLRGFPGAADPLKGVGYATAVCRANLAVADALRQVGRYGLFDNGTRIALDDAFEGGGVWRSHHPGDAETPGDPLSPAGHGWLSTVAVAEEPDAEPVDMAPADDPSLGAGRLLRSDADEIVWRAPLRLAHLVGGWFPLPPEVAPELPALRLCLVLDHDGERTTHEGVAELGRESGRLAPVAWPSDFFPGLITECRWRRGGALIHVATVPLDEPVRVDERVIGHCYDPQVLTRDDVPGSGRQGDTAAGLAPRQLVMRAVRRCGLLTLDGHALLDPSVLPAVVYGPRRAPAQTAALEAAVAELLARRLLERARGSRDARGQPHFPAREAQVVIPLVRYRPARHRLIRPWGSTGLVAEPLQAVQFVPGHLRRLLPGRSPSDAQRVAFREHCRRLGKADGWELPDGYTFVTEHTRGH
ncbi:hypothetical protein OG875_06030 [Streptomyces sp. NBC_01498]|uniref:hypothetical protein n=1 Tax=Streptomyces sp. NBC_01498 TaxID=2975870 RepID=UPI002E7BE033|nr:hypothetical protein [Streptomyces sp. NBC_01498]WTL24208.1 hypothetical protein OG875_06030 [Streptomyces sp. NBC_01498]